MTLSVLEELFSLKGKVVTVTGGGGFIAGTMAKAIAGCGARVAVLDLSKQAAQKIIEEINLSGSDAVAFETNVLDRCSG